MKPILFPASATSFESFGIGVLAEAEKCNVTKDGMMYELELVYPVDGKRYADIDKRAIIYAKPDMVDPEQPFRIYRISKPINGMITVYARHINYDLTGIPVANFTAHSAADFATKIKANALTACPFTFSTDIVMEKDLEFKTPFALRSVLGGQDDTWAERYKGELKFDGYNVQLLNSAGQDRNVTIRYGVDIIDSRVEDDIAELYTGIIPFYSGTETDSDTHESYPIIVIGDAQNVEGSFDYVKLKPVDISQYVSETPSKAKVNEIGAQWIQENDIGTPTLNLTLSYAQLNKIVQQYDTITVEISRLGITKKIKVNKTVYDVLRERYTSVEVGDIKPKLSTDLRDASKLTRGTLNAERIANNSIGSSKYGIGSIIPAAIADGAVVVNKIRNGAIVEEKIADDAVTTNKVLNKAIEYAKLSEELQVFYTEILAANRIYSSVINNDGWITSPVIAATQSMSLRGTAVTWVNASFYDSNTTYWLDENEHWGTLSDGQAYRYYTYDLHSSSGGTTRYFSNILGAPRD